MAEVSLAPSVPAQPIPGHPSCPAGSLTLTQGMLDGFPTRHGHGRKSLLGKFAAVRKEIIEMMIIIIIKK